MSRVGLFWSEKPLGVKPWKRLQELSTFYTVEVLRTLVMPLVQQKSALSLRALDWLVTNYAKKHHVVITALPLGTMPVNIHHEYKTMLGYWRRKLFDPFRRHERLYFHWTHTDNRQSYVEHTTVGQLNFLHWVHTRGIYDYALKQVKDIDADMASTMALKKLQRKQDQTQGIKRKRQELTNTPVQPCFICPLALTFSMDAEASWEKT